MNSKITGLASQIPYFLTAAKYIHPANGFKIALRVMKKSYLFCNKVAKPKVLVT